MPRPRSEEYTVRFQILVPTVLNAFYDAVFEKLGFTSRWKMMHQAIREYLEHPSIPRDKPPRATYGTHRINRVPRAAHLTTEELKKLDELCEQYQIDRTNLILWAVNSFIREKGIMVPFVTQERRG